MPPPNPKSQIAAIDAKIEELKNRRAVLDNEDAKVAIDDEIRELQEHRATVGAAQPPA